MSTIKNFEDLTIWKDSRNLVKTIYSSFQMIKDFGYKDQIQRASISIMNNIAEGFERDSNKEFIRYLYISKASCGEVRSMLYVAKDLAYLGNDQTDNLQKSCRKIAISTNKMIEYLKTTLKH
ncbi:four helix bundle protein [Saccharicrinis sp. FJH54]|uniref:four helix bundle protein n=1 Tax=Saccharicrinis sp. FJH54 TaxID=3344665 RepID=UPI0035D4F7B8